MKGKLKDDKFVKDLLYKFLSLLIIAIVTLLLLNVMTQSKDGRTQIIDEDGGSEYYGKSGPFSTEEQKLAEILKGIKDVGEVKVMLTYESNEASKDFFSDSGKDEKGKVKGAVIIASGGDRAVVKNNIVDAVTALFDIPVKNVKVFERAEEGKINEQNPHQ